MVNEQNKSQKKAEPKLKEKEERRMLGRQKKHKRGKYCTLMKNA